MATLGDLKARIILETNRDELAEGGEAAAALTTAIMRAIEHHSAETFWFSRDSAIVATKSGTRHVVRPYAVRLIDSVVLEGEPLIKSSPRELERRKESGPPSHWAENGELILLWPIPDSVYALDVLGDGQLDAPQEDGDESVWTNEAYDLIAARVRFLLYRDTFRDPEGAQMAAQAEEEALGRLRRETRRRAVTPLRSDLPISACTFNINRGW